MFLIPAEFTPSLAQISFAEPFQRSAERKLNFRSTTPQHPSHQQIPTLPIPIKTHNHPYSTTETGKNQGN
jgi:hypothetical protein